MPAPDGSGLARKEYQPPQGELEEALADIWQELLNIDQVGRQDHFFDLGGHSLLVMKLMERLRQRGWEMSVQSVFNSPELEALAREITSSYVQRYQAPANLILADTQAITPEMLPLFELQPEGSGLSQQEIDHIVSQVPGGVNNIQDIYPLAPLQEGILFHHRLTEHGLYVTPTLLLVESEQRMNSFLSALQAVVDRHDILRTAILWGGLSQSVQVVCREAKFEVEQIELDSDRDERAQLDDLMELSQLHVDVTKAPLMRVQVAPSAEQWSLVRVDPATPPGDRSCLG